MAKWTLSDDTGISTVDAIDADDAARKLAANERIAGVSSSDDLRSAVERAGGYGSLIDPDGVAVWSVGR